MLQKQNECCNSLTDIDESSVLTDGRLWGAADGSMRVRYASVSIRAEGRRLFGQSNKPML